MTKIAERLQAIIAEAEQRIMSQPRAYWGDPDKMTEEQIKETMEYQDCQAVDNEVRRILRSRP